MRSPLPTSSRQAGGRVTLESSLPGFAEWARVRDWRLTQIEQDGQCNALSGKPDERGRHQGFRRRSCCARRPAARGAWMAPGAHIKQPILDADDAGPHRRRKPSCAAICPWDPSRFMTMTAIICASALGRQIAGVQGAWCISSPVPASSPPGSHFTGEQDSTHRRLLAKGAPWLFQQDARQLHQRTAGNCLPLWRSHHHAGCRRPGAGTSRAPHHELYDSVARGTWRHQIGDADRRCRSTRHHRPCRLCGPSLCEAAGCSAERSADQTRPRHRALPPRLPPRLPGDKKIVACFDRFGGGCTTQQSMCG